MPIPPNGTLSATNWIEGGSASFPEVRESPVEKRDVFVSF